MIKLSGDLDVVKNADAGARLVLRHPTTKELLKDEGGEAAITVMGRDSKRYRECSREESKKALETARAAQAADDFTSVDMASVERQAIKILAACTLGWENIAGANGEAIPFNEENALKLYTDFPWIREQVDRFMSARANFFKG